MARWPALRGDVAPHGGALNKISLYVGVCLRAFDLLPEDFSSLALDGRTELSAPRIQFGLEFSSSRPLPPSIIHRANACP